MPVHTATPYGDGATEPGRLLTINDVAYRLAVSRDTVYRLVKSGALSPVRVGERLRFRATDLEAYVSGGNDSELSATPPEALEAGP